MAKKTRQRAEGTGARAALLAVALTMVFVAFVRFRVADVPFERDEGEYAYAGQLILQGVPPYQLAYNMKFPGTYYAYAVILALFGSTAWGVHVGLLLVNAATILLVFEIGRRILGPFPAAIAAASFALLSVDRWIMGVFAHATHFVLLPALAGLVLLLKASESRRRLEYLGAGALLGVAVLMKQHAVFFLPLGAGVLLSTDLRRSDRDLRGSAARMGLFVLGSLLPLAILVVVFLAQGVLGKFWFWTFRYAKEYVTEVPLQHAAQFFANGIKDATVATLLLWLLGAVGFLALWLDDWSATARGFLTALLGASFLSICPGFYFRQHYFILALPAVALLSGVAVAWIDRSLARVLPGRLARVLAILVFLGAAGRYVANESKFLFSMTPRDVSRLRYGSNPFVEAVDIARYIEERTTPTDRIAVLGSEPEIYFYSGRRSATGYIYAYPLMEPQPYARRMQEEMIQEIEAAHPKYVVYAQISASWLARRESDRTILDWGTRYTKNCYDLVGVADIHSMSQTTYAWDAEAVGYRPRSQALVFTYRRKGDAPCTAIR